MMLAFCALNGRFGDVSNNFTSVSLLSYRGSDYFLTSTDDVTLVNAFDILLVHDVAVKYSISVDCTLPDHSILVCKIKLFEDSGTAEYIVECYYKSKMPPAQKMRCNEELLESRKQAIVDLTDRCELVGINKCYSDFEI